jgi:hypothetical protein
MIRVLNDHGGVPVVERAIDGDEIRVDMTFEPMTRADWATHDYNTHFCIGLRNEGDRPARATVHVNGTGFGTGAPRAIALFSASSPDGPFATGRITAQFDMRRRYAFSVTLEAGETVYAANTLVRRAAQLERDFDGLAESGGGRRVVFGRSVQGRNLVAYRYGPNRQRGGLLVTSGFHPPEPDTLGTAAIMGWLAGPAGRALLECAAVVIVPLANPDGYHLGTQGANANGLNFYWNFARDDPRLCPEAAALWRLAADFVPRAYIDFHCYTFQLDKLAGPYCKPLHHYKDPAARRLADAVHRRVASIPDSKPVTGFVTYAPSTLGAQLTAAFQTVTLAKYHLHLAEGAGRCGERAVAVFRETAESLVEAGLAGVPGKERRRESLRRLEALWFGFFRPVIGRARRMQFSQIRFDRAGLVAPAAELLPEP